ncbi:hypothetical protein [Actinomadura macrotermitis]|uniref:Uncharacterized protein n=1 Tax=Actinomadura macrotermitis TaxID=2585200 RepID=A0A7K0C158_9ACTN|nr:hypothetical protein [Actinomadura macrotermitis]MQY07203.1 hypothetical protein [Actinomadura macrotermitis]
MKTHMLCRAKRDRSGAMMRHTERRTGASGPELDLTEEQRSAPRAGCDLTGERADGAEIDLTGEWTTARRDALDLSAERPTARSGVRIAAGPRAVA